MKRFTITVNGQAYDVAVEENNSGAPVAAPVAAAPVAAVPVAAPAPVAAAPAAAPAPVAADGNKVTTPMPGTILDVKVKVGDTVAKNQVVAVLEAMKMENDIVSEFEGQVVAVSVNKGDSVTTGDTLVVIA